MRVTVSGRCQDALNDPQPTDLSILSVSVVDLLTAACGKAAILHRRRLEPMHVVSPAAIRPSALAIRMADSVTRLAGPGLRSGAGGSIPAPRRLDSESDGRAHPTAAAAPIHDRQFSFF